MHVRLGATAPCLHHINPYNSIMIIYSHDCLLTSRFRRLCFAEKWELAHTYYREISSTTQFNSAKKMIGHRSSCRENDDLRLRRGPVVKKKRRILMRAR